LAHSDRKKKLSKEQIQKVKDTKSVLFSFVMLCCYYENKKGQ